MLELRRIYGARSRRDDRPRQRARGRWRRWLCGAALALGLLLAAAYSQKERFSAGFADTARSVIGDQATLRVEGWYFDAQDHMNRLKFRVLGGGRPDPFPKEEVRASTVVIGMEDDGVTGWQGIVELPKPPPPKPAPLALPETKPLRAKLAEGEGVWSTDGLPRTSPDDPLMAKTFIRPDASRDASVGILLIDKRYIKLHISGGTQDPGGDLGVKGPGFIPESDRADLLVAWNGGFKGPHGNYGMWADGKQYRPMRDGLATIVALKDGTIAMGEWGPAFRFAREDMAAARQNAVLLISNCEVSKRTVEGNTTWGFVNVNDTATFITWRSAVGLTPNGDLMVAAGNNLSAATLAKAMWAAGACTAMQLDINVAYVGINLYFPQANGVIEARKFMSSMYPDPKRYFKPQDRDFMYVTLNRDN
jgi:hypothetical protein